MKIYKQCNEVKFYETINSALCTTPGNRQLINRFLSKEKQGISVTRYIVGRNEQSLELAGLIHIDGVIDDYENNVTIWNGIPIIKTSQISENAIVVNCSTSISPVAVQEMLTKAGVKNIIKINELIYAVDGQISLPWFVSQQREDFQNHKLDWFSLYQHMADEDSRKTLLDVMRYRLTADPIYMQGYVVRLKDQYFENFMALKKEVFVDAGGFNGDTTEEFCNRYPDYKKVILFEPSIINMQDAKIRLANYRNIEFITQGISNAQGTLWFNPDAGSASAVSADGSCNIEVTTLDMAVSDKISFIKMDLEGWELKALEGAKQHILEDHPKLAISVYHSASDFWRIPEYIFSIRQDYDIYLRHYTQGWSETVMFFIPNINS